MTETFVGSGRRPMRPGRRRQWNEAAVLAALRLWAKEEGQPPKAYEWDPASAQTMGLYPTLGITKWEREYPRWPGAQTVRAYVGSWRAALQTAGFPSPKPLQGTVAERIQQALALRALPAPEVADLLGVDERTVRKYWSSEPCPQCGRPKVSPEAEICRACWNQRPRHGMRNSFDRASVVQALRDWVREVGDVPTSIDWGADGIELEHPKFRQEHPRWPSVSTVTHYFPSWADALLAAGLPARWREWTEAAAIAAMQTWAQEHGRQPTQDDFGRPADDDWSHPSQGWYARRFGSWTAALSTAGFQPLRRDLTDSEILDELRTFKRRQGRAPNRSDFRNPLYKNQIPSEAVLQRRFGGLAKTWALLGWETTSNAPLDRQQVIEALQAWNRQHGAPPSVKQWSKAGGRPSVGGLTKFFGSWNAALAAAGLSQRSSNFQRRA